MDNDTTPRKICTRCGNEYRATSEHFFKQKLGKFGLKAECKKCTKLYQQSRKEHLRQYQIEWRRKNPELSKEKTKRWRDNHPERAKTSAHESHVRRYTKDPEAQRQRVRDYRRANPEKVRNQYNRYKATEHGRYIVNKQAQIYRMRKRGLPYELSDADWQFCLNHFDHQCAACGKRKGFWVTIVQDHWKPVAKGGATVLSNIVPLCHAKKDGENCCNNTKSDRDAREWLINRFGKRKANQIEKRIAEYFEIVTKRTTNPFKCD